MNVCSAYLVFSTVLLLSVKSMAGNPGGAAGVVGRTIYHSDNTRTETVTDLNIREMVEISYDANNLMGAKKVFMLNEKGEPTQGNVYDAKGNLVARCQTLYDEFGRRKEDRMINLEGEIFQQVLHEYAANGKEKPVKVIHASGKAPMIRPELLDLTKTMPPTGSSQPAQPGGRYAPTTIPAQGAPGTLPPVYAPGAEPQGTTPTEPPKKSFWKRLINK